ncbi:MAG: tetratricopeptide repeat protein, partial [Chloroflexaceae bacterium]|nr:tetratricopeptide repeat protein [Chloroflexaceae bacterium]
AAPPPPPPPSPPGGYAAPPPRSYDYAYTPPPPTPYDHTPSTGARPPVATPAPPEKRQWGLWIGLGVVGVLLLLVVVGASLGLLIAFSDDSDDSDNAPTPVAVEPTAAPPATTEPLVPSSASPVVGPAYGDPETARLLQTGEESLQRRGGMDDAIAAYEQVLEREPANVTALSQLAFIHSLRFQYEQAEELARTAIDADPQAAFAHVILADTLDDRRETFDLAWDAVSRAIELDPDLSFAYAIRAEMVANRAYDTADYEDLQRAITDAEQAIELAANEDNLMKALAHSSRGIVYRYEYWITDDQTKLTLAVEEFNKAIGLQNQIAYFTSSLGNFYNEQGSHDLDQGREAEAYQKLDLAVQKFQEALAIDQSYAIAYNGLGWNAFYREDYAGALEAFEEAVTMDPSNIDAFLGKNLVYRFQSPPDYDQAIEVLNQAAAVAPQNDQVFSWMGWTYLNQETMEAAAEQFRHAIELNPNSADAHRGLGWAAYRQSHYDEAEPHFRRAIELDPSNYEPYLGLGYVLEETNRPDEAREMFEQTLELDPENENALLGLERLDEAGGK